MKINKTLTKGNGKQPKANAKNGELWAKEKKTWNSMITFYSGNSISQSERCVEKRT